MFTRYRLLGWACVALVGISGYLYFAYFEAKHEIPHIEQLSPHAAHHDH